MNNQIIYEKFIVENPQKDETAYTYLKRLGLSENFLKHIRKNKQNLKINNLFENINKKVFISDIIEVNQNPFEKSEFDGCDIPIDVVFEDEYFMIVNKPAGLATMPTKKHYSHNLAGGIVNYMAKKCSNFVCRIINRLDKETSGLVLISKTSIYSKFLLENNKKTYFALASGKIEKPLTINSNILTVEQNGINLQKRVIDQSGKPAITKVYPIKNFDEFTLCKITLENGRTHQIRVHLSSVRHSLVGDTLYGEPNKNMSRTALHCKIMEVVHPKTKEILKFEVNYPEDFLKLIK